MINNAFFLTFLFSFMAFPAAGMLKAAATPAQEKKKNEEKVRQEESEDYYKKWLKEDVFYIITEEEKDVFEKLSVVEEKEQFIEQFWYRRDPDPRTSINEFREEHFRRIAYANENFTSGKLGWLTDRGRIYIIHGPPAEVQVNPSGGMRDRPMALGGGSTMTFPHEVWRYRHVEGIGPNVELEFVDPTMTGEYRLALSPDEKDVFLHIDGLGLTIAEQMGMAEKRDRPYFRGPNVRSWDMAPRLQDSAFYRYELFSKIDRPLDIKYKDLKEIVDINITYDDLPFQVRQDYFLLNEEQVLVPVTLEFENKELTFKNEKGLHHAKVVVYGIITSITNRVIREFEHDLIASYSAEAFQRGLSEKLVYQKIVPLDRKMRYKVDLVVKDVNSGKVGVTRRAITPPSYGEAELSASSIILSDSIYRLPEIPKGDEMFVLGDIKVRPSLSKAFSGENPVSVYLQLYNIGIDQASLSPSLEVSYTVLRDQKPLGTVVDQEGGSIHYFSGQRVVLVQTLPVGQLPPGRYQIEVKVRDRIRDQVVTASDTFERVAPLIRAAAN